MRISENKNLIKEFDVVGEANLGRQDEREDPPYWCRRGDDGYRIVLVPRHEDVVSRKHVQVKPMADRTFQVSNRSGRQSIWLEDNTKLEPGETRKLFSKSGFFLGSRLFIRLQFPEGGDDMQSLSESTRAPGQIVSRSGLNLTIATIASNRALGPEDLIHWLEATMGVLQSAAGSRDFFDKAARATVDMVDLDSARIFLYEDGAWKEQSAAAPAGARPDANWTPSRQVLSRIVDEKRTFWQVPPSGEAGGSLLGIQAVVAAPILNRAGEVIGVLYGDRRSAPGVTQAISKHQAMLVEVLAVGVAAGLARLEQERVSVRFRHFFGGRLGKLIEENPDLLHGREKEVTILFCDIRGFSRISEKLNADKTVPWIRDIMNELTAYVLEEDGVVVDYIGDELMAMWGAPEDQPDHPQRACRAALKMLGRVPELNQRWQGRIGEVMALGIGINTGIAQVGDIGSELKIKYGAMGNTINLASRVQGATKYLKTPLLITHSTRTRLDAAWAVRRLCQVRVVNIAEPVALYELWPPANVGTEAVATSWRTLRREYEIALDQFHAGEFGDAAGTLAGLMRHHRSDGPAIQLLSRVVACLADTPEHFDPVWRLAGK